MTREELEQRIKALESDLRLLDECRPECCLCGKRITAGWTTCYPCREEHRVLRARVSQLDAQIEAVREWAEEQADEWAILRPDDDDPDLGWAPVYGAHQQLAEILNPSDPAS